MLVLLLQLKMVIATCRGLNNASLNEDMYIYKKIKYKLIIHLIINQVIDVTEPKSRICNRV
mgnify:CR=1 FL=1